MRDGDVYFKKVIDENNDTLEISKVVDFESFVWVGKSEIDQKLIRNGYYLNGRMDAFYKDKVNFFFYNNSENPSFFIMGKTQDVQLLGGAYVQIKGEIYYKNLKLDNVDIKSFHTFDFEFNHPTEWMQTIGLDKKNIYIDNRAVELDEFNKKMGSYDSLRMVYFQNKHEK